MNLNNNFKNINSSELSSINGGCGWCYLGGGLIVVGSIMTGGLLGGVIGVAGVLTVFGS